MGDAIADAWDVQNQPREAGMERNFVHFHYVTKIDKKATKEQGRPIYKKVEYILFKIPGDKFNQPDIPVTDKHRDMYAARYRAFLKSENQDEADGTPLKAWVILDPGCRLAPEVIEEYAYFNIKTVQQLAAVTEGNIPPIPKFREIQKRAQAWLQVAADDTKLKDELGKRDAQIATLMAEVAALKGAPVEATPEPAPVVAQMPIKRRPGRPAKEQP